MLVACLSLGWYHYHAFSSGFGAETLAMCSRCGAQHRIRHALTPEVIDGIRCSGDRFNVALEAPGDTPVVTRAALRKLTGCSLSEAQRISRSTPFCLGTGLRAEDAEHIRAPLEAAGARVTVSVIHGAEPVEVPPQMQDELWIAGVAPEEWHRCLVFGERTQVESFLSCPYPFDSQFDLARQACGQCGAQGALVSGLPEGLTPCPRCGEQLEMGCAWIT
jgi:ribosomal protein L7/L12